mmetsp:Transcript_101937/g.297266  ORF Transcript_101937/g.297266 Transcript_101937/m.297266 type:complete len:513 (-) Transcript_101937:144-1682(-)
MKRAAEGHGDAGRRGPKLGKSARFGPHAFKVLCPEQMVAKMMGNQGATVHQIEGDTSSHLQFSPRGEYYPETRFRILTVHAPEVGLVMDVLAALLDQVIVRAEEEAPSAKARAAGDFVDSAGKLLFRCALSKAAAGAVIGSKGERVRSIRETTGCNVDIAREVVDNHQLVTLAGSRDQILAVLEELNGSVQADADSAWFAEWSEQRVMAGGDGARRPSRAGATSSAPSKGGRTEEHINCTIFVGRLAQATDADRLRQHFSQYGRIVDADVRTDPATGRSKGFGFVTFADPSMAEAVLSAYDEHEIDDRRVDVKRYGDSGGGREEEPAPPAREEAWERNGHGSHRPGDRYEQQPQAGFDAASSIDWFAGLADAVPSDYLGLDYCICCSLPSAKCGALIGRRGEHVAEVQRATGAVVSVSKKDPHESLDAHRQVTITGQLLSVYAAHLLLMRHYNDEEAQFHASTNKPEGSTEIEDLQRQLSELSQELNKVRNGAGPGPSRRRSPQGRPKRAAR